jgi:hypothetical protein
LQLPLLSEAGVKNGNLFIVLHRQRGPGKPKNRNFYILCSYYGDVMKINYLVTGLCVGLLLVTCMAVVSAGSDIQIEGAYRELWNQTLNDTIMKDVSEYVTPTVMSIDDISCDGKTDVILIKQNDTNVTLEALCGKNGTQLWAYNITGANPDVYVYPVDDMTCDGKTDFIVSVDEYSLDKTTIIGLGGKNGTELWNKTISSSDSTGSYHSIRVYPVEDLNGDNKTDIILKISVVNATEWYDQVTVTALALAGKNGTELWRWTQTDPYCYSTFSLTVMPVDDMTCDGKTDVVLTTFHDYDDSVYVLDGTNGTELWSELNSAPGRMGVYPGYDLNCDNKTDVILVQDYYNHYRVRALRGKDKSLLWEKNATLYPQYIYPVDDLSCDGKTDIVFQELTKLFEGDLDGDGYNDTWIYNYTLEALVGTNGTELWSWTWNRTLISDYFNNTFFVQVYPVGDISCDGKTDVIASICSHNYSSNVSTLTIIALDGHIGEELWTWSLTRTDLKIDGSPWDVISVDDMTCDGKDDIIVTISASTPLDMGWYWYSGPPYMTSVVALDGRTGTFLWQEDTPLSEGPNIDIIPVDDLSCDGKTDIVLKITDYNYSALSQTITVKALIGKNGTLLWEENLTGGYSDVGIMDVYLTGDFSCDGKTDVILKSMDRTNETSKVWVKEGKTGRDVITISSDTTLISLGMFYRLRVEYFINGDILYYWERDNLVRYDMTCENISDLVVGGGREVYAITKLPCGDSSEDDRTIKNTFFTDEDVYAIGSGFAPLDWINISVVLDRDWTDGASIPADVSSDGVNTVQADANGSVFALVWPQPLTVGAYDIVFDADQNGVYNAGIDAVDSASPGFVVQERPAAVTKAVPVLTTLGLGLLMVFMVLVAVLGLKRRPEKK